MASLCQVAMLWLTVGSSLQQRQFYNVVLQELKESLSSFIKKLVWSQSKFTTCWPWAEHSTHTATQPPLHLHKLMTAVLQTITKLISLIALAWWWRSSDSFWEDIMWVQIIIFCHSYLLLSKIFVFPNYSVFSHSFFPQKQISLFPLIPTVMTHYCV